MNQKHSTKKTLATSLIALVLCFAMLIGTTYAWFTDSVTSANNIIATGDLDVELYHADNGTNGVDKLVDENTVLFDDVDSDLWEPGAMAWERFTIKNAGSLALLYRFALNATNATVVDGVSFASMLKAAVVDESFEYSRENVNKIPKDAWKSIDSLEPLASDNAFESGSTKTFGIVLYWQPSSNDNLFNMNNGRTDVVSIEVGVLLTATQAMFEGDSFDNTYDSPDAIYAKIDTTVSAPVTNAVDASNKITTAVTVGNADDEDEVTYATVPSGVQMAAGATSLTLSVKDIENSTANVVLGETEKMRTLDVHMAGVDENNTVPMTITIKGVAVPGLNNNNIKLYHVEDGTTVPMTLVALAELDAHNEFYYNPITGDVTLSLASFSEVAVVADTDNSWNGTAANGFSEGIGTEAEPYMIATAEQLAYFRNLVDGGKSFQGEYVQLACDIILNREGTADPKQFDPIGWGYAYSGYNAGGTAGKVFMGTFDGDGHAIHGLWQNGWDLETATGTDYTYTNCGMGLFASVQDATIKNLTVKHANVVAECVEMGIVAGLAQGNCTFENIMVYSSHIANYQRATGGVVGEVSAKYDANGQPVESTVTFKDVHVGSSCTVGSLWGDFDCPVGGVVGAYWDDSTKTNIVMDRVDVSCVLDVYNDVTSAYQWYAYRRAGMLIGNSDRVDPKDSHKAYAPYLTCTNCVVIYDTWTNYSYCEFTNENNPGRNYPWVRVEPSQYNSSYSNPRYGHPTDAAGNTVVDDIHLHQAGDECTTLLKFNQLYGGGQGVYGNSEHTGVTEGKYTITFIGADGDVLDVWYITEADMNSDKNLNELGHEVPFITNGTNDILAWEDANGNAYAKRSGDSWTYNNSIKKGNLVDIVLYPEWSGEYNIYFLDHNGKTLYYEKFDKGQPHTLNTAAIEAQRLAIQNELDNTANVIQVKWDRDLTTIDFEGATNDITVKLELNLSTTSITLTPVYDETTNQLIEYHVSDVNISDSNLSLNIPSHVGTVPVAEITEGAFDGFDNLTAVKIPNTITSLGAGMFPGGSGLFAKRQTVTIYYEGTRAEWDALVENSSADWYEGLGDGSRVFFLDKNEKVIFKDETNSYANLGFYELYKKNVFSSLDWVHHTHEYVQTAPEGCTAAGHYKSFTDYTAEGRPDRNYWITTTATETTDETTAE